MHPKKPKYFILELDPRHEGTFFVWKAVLSPRKLIDPIAGPGITRVICATLTPKFLADLNKLGKKRKS